MEYKDLENVNKTLKSIDVKNKSYIEVNERIKGFRQLFPNGSIETNIELLENNTVVMSCTVKDEEGKVLSKAHAYEKEGSTFINKTSFIENCCTSATGRALGYLGIGIDTSVASAEEVQNAIAQQEADEKLSEKEARVLYEFMKKRGLTDDKITETLQTKYSVDNVYQLNGKQYAEIIRNLKDKQR